MKYKLKISVLTLSLILLGAGCLSGDTDLTQCNVVTAHESCVDNGVDEALLGSWTLESQTLGTPAGSISNPFSGRTLTFANDGSYTEDYSTEEVADVSVAGITSSCNVLGALSGTYNAVYLEQESAPPIPYSGLRIIPNGGSPTVTCQATGSPISSNAASTPLGVGEATGVPPYVEYEYTVNNNWTELTIVQNNTIANITNTYLFTR